MIAASAASPGLSVIPILTLFIVVTADSAPIYDASASWSRADQKDIAVRVLTEAIGHPRPIGQLTQSRKHPGVHVRQSVVAVNDPRVLRKIQLCSRAVRRRRLMAGRNSVYP